MLIDFRRKLVLAASVSSPNYSIHFCPDPAQNGDSRGVRAASALNTLLLGFSARFYSPAHFSVFCFPTSSTKTAPTLDLSRIIDPPEVGDEPTPRPTSPAEVIPDEINEPEASAPSLSFIVAIEAKEEGRVCYMSESVSEILGFDKDEVIGTPAFGFCHPDDAGQLYRAYQEMISEDKAACLLYLRVKHRDPRKGALLSSISCSRVGQHIIGAVSLASSATKAMHNASTAQEVIVIAPSAAHLEFRRWNDPPHVPPPPPSVTTPPSAGAPGSPVSRTSSQGTGSVSSRESSLEASSPPQESDELSQSFSHLTLSPPAHPELAKRVAFVLNRFSINVPITYSSNDDILPRSLVVGRPFYDFVTPGDESRIRKAMDAVKGWGVNERGHPSDGGFAFNRFHLQLRGRDSSVRPDPAPHRNRRAPHSDTSGAKPSSRDVRAGSSPAPVKAKDPKPSTPTSSRNRIKQRTPSERGVNAATRDTQLVDAIFSPQSDGIIVIIRPALQTA